MFQFQNDKLNYEVPRAIPIFIAGRGPRILELAGRLGDGVIVASFAGGSLLDYALERVAAGESKRDPALPCLVRVLWAYVSVDSDRTAARRAVRRGIAVALWGSRSVLDGLGVVIPSELRDLMDNVQYSARADVLSQAKKLIPDELIDDWSIAGTPAECAERLRTLIGRGFDHIAVWPFPPAGKSVDRMLDQPIEIATWTLHGSVPPNGGNAR